MTNEARKCVIGLTYCGDPNYSCEQCPVYESGKPCQNDLKAAYLIESLSEELEETRRLTDDRLRRKNMYRDRSEQDLLEKIRLRIELENVMKQAAEDMKMISDHVGSSVICTVCAHRDIKCTECNFEWRGMKNEN